MKADTSARTCSAWPLKGTEPGKSASAQNF
jgi:hypothetical protein